MWDKTVSFFKGAFKKVKEAFAVKPRNAEGKIGKSWFGKWIASPVMTAANWVSRVLVWVARVVAYIIIAVLFLTVVLVALAILLVAAVVLALVFVLFRAVQGICLAVSTPYNA